MKKGARVILFCFCSSVVLLTFQNCAQNNYAVEAVTGNPSTMQNLTGVSQDEAVDDVPVSTMPVEEPMGDIIIGRQPTSESSSPTVDTSSSQTNTTQDASQETTAAAPPVVVIATETVVMPPTAPAPMPSAPADASSSSTTTPASESSVAQAPSMPPVVSDSAPILESPTPVVCDPLSQTVPGVNPGIRGELYYLPQGSARPNNVFDYFTLGTKVNVDLYLSQIKTPTTNFEKGFVTADGEVLRDNGNNTLVEYFALKLQSVIKLGAKDRAGLYQFALLSDDGAVLDITDKSGTEIRIVDNNGTHPTRMGCANNTVYMDSSTRLPMKLYYYQGPRVRVSLMLKWRLISGGRLGEQECGKQGDNYFFDSSQGNSPETSAHRGLSSRGWKTLNPDNYETTTSTTQVVCK